MTTTGITKTAAKRAVEELGETAYLVASAPNELRAALRTAASSPEFKDVKDDLLKATEMNDTWLLRFLRARKYDVEGAAANVVAYFRWIEAQAGLPDDFMGHGAEGGSGEERHLEYWSLRCEDVEDVLTSGIVVPLPGYDATGAKIIFVRPMGEMGKILKKYPMKKIVLAFQYLMDQLSLDPNVQICGLGIVEDLSGFDVKMYMDLMRRKDVHKLQKKKALAMNSAYPFRFADMWIIDSPWYFRFVWVIFRLLLKKKIRDRIHLLEHDNLKGMYKNLKKEQLPVSLGGLQTEDELAALTRRWIDERIEAEAENMITSTNA